MERLAKACAAITILFVLDRIVDHPLLSFLLVLQVAIVSWYFRDQVKEDIRNYLYTLSHTNSHRRSQASPYTTCTSGFGYESRGYEKKDWSHIRHSIRYRDTDDQRVIQTARRTITKKSSISVPKASAKATGEGLPSPLIRKIGVKTTDDKRFTRGPATRVLPSEPLTKERERNDADRTYPGRLLAPGRISSRSFTDSAEAPHKLTSRGEDKQSLQTGSRAKVLKPVSPDEKGRTVARKDSRTGALTLRTCETSSFQVKGNSEYQSKIFDLDLTLLHWMDVLAFIKIWHKKVKQERAFDTNTLYRALKVLITYCEWKMGYIGWARKWDNCKLGIILKTRQNNSINFTPISINMFSITLCSLEAILHFRSNAKVKVT